MEDSTTPAEGKPARPRRAKQNPPTPGTKKAKAAPTKAASAKAVPAKAGPTMARAKKNPKAPPAALDHGGSDPSTGDKVPVIKQTPAKAAKVAPKKAAKPAAKKPTNSAPTKPKNAVPLRQSTGPKRASVAPTASAPGVTGVTTTEKPTESAAPPRQWVPVEATVPFTGVPARREWAWADVVAEPGRAPERLAAAAVRQLGPEAAHWVAAAKDRYPRATPDGLARLASRQFTKVARREGLANGAAGLLGSLAATGALARTHARLVLHIAAAYGLDPRAPERARDLVELLRIPRRSEPARAAVADSGRLIGPFLLRRASARLLPFGAAIAAAVHGGQSTTDLAARAMRHYRRWPTGTAQP